MFQSLRIRVFGCDYYIDIRTVSQGLGWTVFFFLDPPTFDATGVELEFRGPWNVGEHEVMNRGY